MPIDQSAVGTKGAEFEMIVERGKIFELARAIHATHPSHFRSEGPVAPPTFLTTTHFWEQLVPGANPWALLKIDTKRGLHAEQEYVFHGPPPTAGTRLRCRSRIESVYQKQGRRGGRLTFAVMVTEFRDEAGNLVAEARLTGVETDRPPEEPQT